MDVKCLPELREVAKVVKEGFLVKGTGMRAKKRFFSLDGVSLQYFADETLTDMKGEIKLRDAQVSIFSGATGKGFFFELLEPRRAPDTGVMTLRRFTLNAATVKERTAWCHALASNILAYHAANSKRLSRNHLMWKVLHDELAEPTATVFEGWLLKGSGLRAKRRYCRLLSSMTLLYYTKDNDDDASLKVSTTLELEEGGDAAGIWCSHLARCRPALVRKRCAQLC
jgi:hypothetical protein